MEIKNVIIAFTVSFLYSLLRYNVFGNMPFTDIPSIILNKAISFTAIFCLFYVYICKLKKIQTDLFIYQNAFKILTVIHVLISIVFLMNKSYSKFFDNQQLTLYGKLSILTGLFAFVFIFLKLKNVILKKVILMLLIATHLFFTGSSSWFQFEKWNGMMPPITLICFTIVLFLIFNLLTKKNEKKEDY